MSALMRRIRAPNARWRMVGGFLAFGVLCLATLVFAATSVASDAIQRQINDRVVAVGSHSAVYLDQVFGAQDTLLQQFSRRSAITAALNPGGNGDQALSELQQLQNSNPNIIRATLVDANGHVAAAFGRNSSATGADESSADWWKEARSSAGVAVSRPHADGNSDYVTSAIGVSTAGGAGVVAIDYRLDAIRVSLQDFANSQQLSLLVVDRSDDVITSTGDTARAWLSAGSTGPIARGIQGSEGVEQTTISGQDLLAAYAVARTPGWVVVASLPTGDAFAPVHQLQLSVLVITLALALIFLVGVRHLDEALRRRQTAEDALRRAAQELEFQAMHDKLTGLANRSLFTERLDQCLRRARRLQEQVSILFLDMNRFKQVNDTLGHHEGDLLLTEVGRRMQVALRDSDTAARFGGDEFAVILPATDRAGAQHVGDKLRSTLGQQFILGEHTVESGASIGVAVFPEDGYTVDRLMNRADADMYAVKRRRRASTGPTEAKPIPGGRGGGS